MFLQYDAGLARTLCRSSFAWQADLTREGLDFRWQLHHEREKPKDNQEQNPFQTSISRK